MRANPCNVQSTRLSLVRCKMAIAQIEDYSWAYVRIIGLAPTESDVGSVEVFLDVSKT